MKNLFSRTFSLLCAVTLLICAVSSWAFAEEPATPTDLTAEEGTVQTGTNNSGGSSEDPAESVEILITKSLKLGESWEGVAKNTRPAILKLDLDKAETVYMILEGNHVTAAIQKADRPEEILYTVTTDPDTKQAVISWEAEQGSYLITICPEEPNLMAKARVTFLDEEAYVAWEEALNEETEEPVEAKPQEDEPEESDKSVDEQTEAPEQELTDVTEDKLLPDSDPNRSVDVELCWDVPYPIVGDTAHLSAVLNGYEELSYTVQWQYSMDRALWTDVLGANETRLDVVINEENNHLYWRLVVYLEDISEE